ncbi:sigma-70 family RNA polymerase sigma factor [Salicibibacter kimchii]|uniref:Sigma-70 family RNA polymerase sigma factor n=1 Tax=Salicibibacter kimchii TaxID=2099786 RepID=A0A345BZ19_9BACI|nr:sigma-70 family RNA polymerase sigma factor [Salicibibacter kimchii]AXF56200.1 sigma-70 family RNA polymerase sigma factor [Salicibibacter kimchii]
MNQGKMEQLKKKCPRIALFFDNNPKLAEQRIFQSFLEDDENLRIFIQAICVPGTHAFRKLDEAFKNHYANVQFTQYLSKTLYWTSVQYDQHHREHRNHQRLTMDNLYDHPSNDMPNLITETNDLGTWSDDVALTNALRQLTDKQQTVITERYGYERTNNEIARLLNVSPQAVSRTHLHALKRLRSLLKKEVEK